MLSAQPAKTLLPKNRRVSAALIAIVLLGAALRFTSLDHESLWNDELAKSLQANQPNLLLAIKAGSHYEGNPPGIRIILFFIEKTLGQSEAALRFPSAVAGTLAIIAIFFLGRRLYSDREGLIAALLMAVLWCPLFYSQDASAYSYLLLLSIVSMLVWLPLIERVASGRRPSRRLIALYLFIGLVTCYLHYYGALLIGLQGLASLWIVRSKHQPLKPAILLYVPIGLIELSLIPFILLAGGRGNTWILRPTDLIGTFTDYLAYFFNQSPGFLLVVGGLAAAAIVRSLKHHNFKDWQRSSDLLSATPMLLAWLVLPFLFVYLFSQLLPILSNRYLIIALPAAYLLLARSITRLTVSPLGQTAISIALSAVFMYNLLYVYNYYTQPHKDQFREAVASIVQRAADYPQAYVLGYGYGGDYFNYYFQHFNSPLRVNLDIFASDQNPAVKNTIQHSQPKYIWLVSGLITPDDSLLAYLNQDYQLINQQAFLKAGVWLYQRKSS